MRTCLTVVASTAAFFACVSLSAAAGMTGGGHRGGGADMHGGTSVTGAAHMGSGGTFGMQGVHGDGYSHRGVGAQAMAMTQGGAGSRGETQEGMPHWGGESQGSGASMGSGPQTQGQHSGTAR